MHARIRVGLPVWLFGLCLCARHRDRPLSGGGGRKNKPTAQRGGVREALPPHARPRENAERRRHTPARPTTRVARGPGPLRWRSTGRVLSDGGVGAHHLLLLVGIVALVVVARVAARRFLFTFQINYLESSLRFGTKKIARIAKMAPRGARGAVSEPSDEAAPAAVTANGPPSDPEGAAKDSSGDVAATVEKPPGALGESKGPEPDGGAAEAEGAAEANNTENKADEKAGAVLDQLRDEADSRVKTVTAEPSFASKTLLERFKSSPVLNKGTDTFPFEKLLPNALLYAREAHKCSDGISALVTFSTFAPRPASYEAPDEIEGAVYPFTHLTLNTRSYGAAGEAKDVVYCTLYESGSTSPRSCSTPRPRASPSTSCGEFLVPRRSRTSPRVFNKSFCASISNGMARS